MTIKVSLINMKGGVGKSTLTVNLAWHFAFYGKKVLVVDLDPQFNASQYLLGVDKYKGILDSESPTIWDIFEQGTRTPSGRVTLGNHQDVIYRHMKFRRGGCIHLVPSRLELALSLKNPGNKGHKLSRWVKKVEESYDLILIDCAPTESVLTTAAYRASEWLLVPVKPEYLSTIGLPLLVNSMDEFNGDENGNSNLQLAGVVFNATSDYLPEEREAKEEVLNIAKKNGWHVFDNEVEYSRSYPKGAREGRPLFLTSYSRSSKAINFKRVAEELARRIKL